MLSRVVRQLTLALAALSMPAAMLAQAYGQGMYGSVEYSNGIIQVGPITLPNTGTMWVGLISIVAAAVITAIMVYRRTIRQEKAEQGIQ